MLKNKFYTLCQNFSTNEKTIEILWEEIKTEHSHSNRVYHTLKHLEHIYVVLKKPTLLMEFAIFYHDIVYNASRSDNEEQSAMLCSQRLSLLKVPQKLVDAIHQLIMETKTHAPSSEQNALFLDADLAILGSDSKVYVAYTQKIRKEYALYKNDVYHVGRKKVLKHFLGKNKIYQSKYFHDKYEKQARENILMEYNCL